MAAHRVLSTFGRGSGFKMMRYLFVVGLSMLCLSTNLIASGYVAPPVVADATASSPKRPDDCNHYSGSYVVLHNPALNQVLPIAGTDMTLHYSSRNTTGSGGANFYLDGLLAKGWDISGHHRLYAEGGVLIKSSGERLGVNVNYAFDTQVTSPYFMRINERYEVKIDNLEYRLSPGGDYRHDETRDALSESLLYSFDYRLVTPQYGNPYYPYQLGTVTDHRNGTSITIHYDSNDTPEYIEADNGQKTYLEIINGHLMKIRYENDPSDPSDDTSYEFDYIDLDQTGQAPLDGLMSYKKDPNGNVYTYEYDNIGLLTKVTNPIPATFEYGHMHETAYHYSSIKYPLGETIDYKNYEPDENGMSFATAAYPSGNVVEYNQSIEGNLSIIEACGMNTRIERYLDHIAKEEPQVSSYSVTTPSGLKTQIDFNVTSVEGKARIGLFSPYHYTETYKIKTETYTATHNAHTTTLNVDYDKHTKVIDYPTGEQERYLYDKNMRNILEHNNTRGDVTYYSYDDKNRLTSVKFGNRERMFAYDLASGNLLSMTDYVFNTVIMEYDDEGEVTNTTDYVVTAQTTYGYNSKNHLTSITWTNGSTATFEYDNNGNMVMLNTPTQTSASEHEFTYNAINKPTQWSEPTGFSTFYEYDLNRRVTAIIKPERRIDFGYLDGRLSTVSSIDGTNTISYDCGSRISSVSSSTGESINLTHDGDLITSLNYSGMLNETINFTYNNSFLPSSISYAGAQASIAYDAIGRMVQIGNAAMDYNKTLMTLTDNVMSKALHVTPYNETDSINNKINNKNIYAQTIHSRDLQGHILSMSEQIGKRTYRHTYSYDTKGNLIHAKTVSGKIVLIPYDDLVIPVFADRTNIEETFAYDSEGNRVAHNSTINGVTTNKTASFYHNALDEIEGTFYTYDNDGYLSGKSNGSETTTYAYGSYGQLKRVTTPTHTVEYLHNANHQRVAKKVDGQITEKYLWLNLTTLLATYDANDNLINRYYYANERVPYKMTHNGVTYYLSYNHLGSLRAVATQEGTIVKAIDYDAYGQIVNDTNSSLHVSFGFAGGLYDPDTELTRFGYRDYDAETGKWTAKDPIGFSGGDTNLYGYVLNDPVNLVDPEGLWSFNMSGYYGLGGGVSFGSNPDGRSFFSITLGFGIGGGAVFNSTGTSSNYNPNGSYGVGVGINGGVGVNFGPAALGYSGYGGVTTGANSLSEAMYGDQEPSVGITGSNGFNAGVNIGGECVFTWQ